ncbi:MAG: class I SAM-dependent methyltransferase [Armatimonadetes bacterium]|nr:class I SAM-dependent methyltransferase [Armatimonadota bacterium]
MSTTETQIATFKQRVESDWGGMEAAAAWQKHYKSMRDQLAPVTQAIVEAANPQSGMNILDLASGTGDPALSLARRVAPGGTVTATDFNPHMLAALRQNALDEGVANVLTHDCDAHELPFEDHRFDIVTSRFGVMFCGELDRALSGVRRVLKSSGRIAFLVWGAPAPGTYFGSAVVPYVKRMAEKPDPDGPGPMRFAEPGKLVKIVEKAGFTGVQEVSLTLPTPFPGTARALLDQLFEIAAPFRNLADALSPGDRRAADQEALDNLTALERDGWVHVKAPVIIVTATSP